MSNRSGVRLKLIACEILYREICAAVSRSPNKVDVEFLPKGLHDMATAGMCERLQAALDAVDESQYDAVALGYALCGTGLVGLTARGLPVALPRAHDCITLFLGSKERYLDYFNSHPGVYFKTTGWIERGQGLEQLNSPALRDKTGIGYVFEDLVAKYGEDNARYLWEKLGNLTRNYGQFTFIEMGVEPDDRFERETRKEAARRNWKFEKIQGDMTLIRRLVDAEWDSDDFLVLQPGWRVVARYDGSIVGAEKAQ
ncbi:MAG TPA: DUF1638 domain-containing protein [Bryobacteraceae bacterium]|nr:DUF1638 domain-containing protein [Bryobacteraceae bacterium]HOQ46142.1 DUF1638 domain-containing protein [Bryobacteraceae bacterium]HPU72717.1 DUF1638 domain-containing protein [Bryobacteraceae bacterium]